MYSDTSFSTQIGTLTLTYNLSADTIPDSALLQLTTTEFDLDGSVDFTSIDLYHLHKDGTLTIINTSGADGVENLVLTYE